MKNNFEIVSNQGIVKIVIRTSSGYCVKNHESDPAISREVDPSFVRINQDQLVGGNWC